MAEMPKEIWAHCIIETGKFGAWDDEPVRGALSYTRTDLVDARVARMREALDGIKEYAEEMIRDCCADIQEGGTGNGIEKWQAVLAALQENT